MTVYNAGQQQQNNKLADESEEVDEFIVRSVNAYWDKHKLQKLSVDKFIEEFCGWQAITDLIKHPYNSDRDRAFLSALFLTGGRVTEVLNLTVEMFSLKERKDGKEYIRVDNMMLEKRYRKLGDKYVGDDGKKHYDTETLIAVRKPFAIMLDEPLTEILVKWLSRTKEGLLFPSPYNKREGKPLTRFWAYKYIRKLYDLTPYEIQVALGMKKPFVLDGEKIDDEIHLWCHWFRAQRASQLVRDYKFDLPKLMSYFSWLEVKTALRYLRIGAKGLADTMDVDEFE